MVIFRKIGTAIKVFKKFGFKETVGLLKDNIRNLFVRITGLFCHFFHTIYYRLRVIGETNRDFTKILYVTTNAEATLSQTVRYRINNLIEGLKNKAYTRLLIIDKDKSKSDFLIDWADIIVVMRTIYIPDTARLLLVAKAKHKPVVFDIDDIIFLTKYAKNYCEVIGDTSEKMLKKQNFDFDLFEKTFNQCCYSTASTYFIAEKMKQEGKKVGVIHNGFNNTQLNIAEKAIKTEKKEMAISYLSGTKTHDRDFEQALPAIVRIMNEYPDLKLKVAGYLDLSVIPENLKTRVKPACYMNWQRLMKYSATNYINIAPLDINNEFCHAKSELKFFESALVGVPTVASATDTFKRAINSGENGMLASNEEEWYNSLKKLLDDKEFYKKISVNAKKSALENYSPEHISDEALAVYKEFIEDNKAKLKTQNMEKGDV